MTTRAEPARPFFFVAVGSRLSFKLLLLLLLLVLLPCCFLSTAVDATTEIVVDPTNGADAMNCGVGNATACASVSGALSFNNVTQYENVTYALRLQDGNYTGKNNVNIKVPTNVMEISSVSMNAQGVVFFGQFSNTSLFSGVFIVQSSVQISNITFAGTFAYAEPGGVVYYANCVYININSSNTNTSNINISLSGVTLQGDTQIVFMVQGGLPSGASLTVSDVNINWVSNQTVSAQANLISVWALGATGNNVGNTTSPLCTESYSSWPQLIVNNVRVQNSNSLGLFGFVPGLLFTTDVAVTISNVEWFSTVYVLISTQTSCSISTFGSPDSRYGSVYSLPPVSISNLAASSISYYGWFLMGIVGGQISLTGLDISSISKYSNLQSQGLLSVAPQSAFSLTNSTFSNIGNVVVQNPPSFGPIDASIVYLVWDSASQQQLSNRSSTQNLLQNLWFTSNTLRPITLLFNSLSSMDPSEAFGTTGVSVEIDSCYFVNNNGTLLTGNPGGAIQAQAQTFTPAANNSFDFTNYYSTLKNSISISNSLFEKNVANNYGGAISLGSVSANITNSTFSDNSVETFLSYSSSMSVCNLYQNLYLGGGGIYASGYSAISFSKNVKFIDNQVLAAPAVPPGSNIMVPTTMSGAILCCSQGSIAVSSDGTTIFEDNTAPIIPDMSCSSSLWHEKLVTCDFQGSSNETQYCEFGKSTQPVWLYAVIAAVVVSVFAVIGYVVYKKRQSRQKYSPLLGDK